MLGDVVLVATSGGADSAAALLWARARAPDARIVACYVDHGVRPKASRMRDIAAVRAQARAVRARVTVERIQTVRPAGASFEAHLRELRYAALAHAARRAGARYVVLGHHADDVAESLLLNLMRGSGLDGAAAMRRVREIAAGIYAVRPLLGSTKKELERRVAAARLPVSVDETNADASLRRNAVRALIAQLAKIDPGAPRALARSARLLRGDASLMRAIARQALDRARRDDGALSAEILAGLPGALASHAIRLEVLARTGSLDGISQARTLAVLRALRERRGGNFELRAGVWARISRGAVIVTSGSPAPTGGAPAFAPRTIRVPAVRRRWATPLGELEIERAGSRTSAEDVCVTISPGTTLDLRTAMPADTCVPSGRRRPVSLARFLGKCGVPRWQRERATVLCDGGRIVAVLGVRAMEPYAAKGSEQSYIVRWRPITEAS